MTKRQQRLLQELESLPRGYISRKTIRGREVFYHQWRENGRVRSKYLKREEVDGFRERIRRRHAIQEILLKEGALPSGGAAREDGVEFETDVKTGSGLREFARGVEGWERRDALRGLFSAEQQRAIARVHSDRAAPRTGWVSWLGTRLTVMTLARDLHPIPPT